MGRLDLIATGVGALAMISSSVFAVLAGLYGWQVHGWLVGVLAAAAMITTIILMNTIHVRYLIKRADEIDGNRMIEYFQKIKWIGFGIIMVAIAISGTEIVTPK